MTPAYGGPEGPDAESANFDQEVFDAGMAQMSDEERKAALHRLIGIVAERNKPRPAQASGEERRDDHGQWTSKG